MMTTNNTYALDRTAELAVQIKLWREFIWMNILPVICIGGILANSLNIAVFKNRKKLKTSIYYYLLCHSIANLIYLLAAFLYFFGVKRFTTLNGFASKVWDLYIFRTLTAMVAMFMMLIELQVSFKRLLIVSNYSFKRRKIPFFVSLIFIFIFSVISQLSVPFTYDVIRIRDGLFDIKPNALSKTKLLSVLNFASSVFRGILAPLLLLVINLIMAVKYRSRLRKKLNLRTASSNDGNSGYFVKIEITFTVKINLFFIFFRLAFKVKRCVGNNYG